MACCISKIFYAVPTTSFDLFLHALFATSLAVLKQRGFNGKSPVISTPDESAYVVLTVDVLKPKETIGRTQHSTGFNMFNLPQHGFDDEEEPGRHVPVQFSPFQARGLTWPNLPFFGTGYDRQTRDQIPATWDEIGASTLSVGLLSLIFGLDQELDAVIKGTPGTLIPSDSPTAVRLRKEKANKYCSGSNYKGNILEDRVVLEYGVWIGKGRFIFLGSGR